MNVGDGEQSKSRSSRRRLWRGAATDEWGRELGKGTSFLGARVVSCEILGSVGLRGDLGLGEGLASVGLWVVSERRVIGLGMGHLGSLFWFFGSEFEISVRLKEPWFLN
ncbi:unnamed protein product [Linum trigynum]|uniref:Uncharacterized protein n=1 Tax=Linum trigynum TaxID=586398 RepID=A0AAV2CZ25_9ROSI